MEFGHTPAYCHGYMTVMGLPLMFVLSQEEMLCHGYENELVFFANFQPTGNVFEDI